MTHRASIDGGLSGAWTYDQLLTSPGATGTRTWTGSGSGVGWTLALLGIFFSGLVSLILLGLKEWFHK